MIKSRNLDELPTILLILLCYVCFFAVILNVNFLGVMASTLALVPILVLHSSLQHECLHGHPTRIQWINDVIASPALGGFIPYMRFKSTHLDHHYDPNLTDPYDDPESNYLSPTQWQSIARWWRVVRNFNNTLLGRMLIGPAIGLVCFYHRDLRKALGGETPIITAYVQHFITLVPMIWLIHTVSDLPLWAYGVAAYAAMSVLKIRTYLEHTAHERVAARTVVIEDRGPLALLFLNNNYHSVHHAHPSLAWHRLPAQFRAQQDLFLRKNGGYWFKSYAQVIRMFLLKQKDPVAHPLGHINAPATETTPSHISPTPPQVQ